MKAIDAFEQYEALARWVFKRASREGPPALEALSMHKPLDAPKSGDNRPAAGMVGLDNWLIERVCAGQPAQIVDLGCGFGATLLRCAPATTARLHGIGASPFQIQTARELTRRETLDHRASFTLGDFETTDLPAASDAVIAIESIGYSRDLSAVARRLYAQLSPAGQVFLLDDWRAPGAETSDTDYQRFLHLWGRIQIPTLESVLNAFTAAGFQLADKIDLSDQVPVGTRSLGLRTFLLSLSMRLVRSNARRALVAAFLGGCHLEALYSRGKTRYHFLHFQKIAA